MTKTLLIILTVITLQTCISSTPPINYSEPIWEPQTEVIQGMKKAYYSCNEGLICKETRKDPESEMEI